MTTLLLGAQRTGWLTAAFVIVTGMVELLGTTVLMSLYPMMSRHSGATLQGIVRRLAWFTLLPACHAACCSLSLFAAEITVPLFGADFAPAAEILRILVWYALVRLVADVYIQALITGNRQRRMLVVYGGGLLLNVALNLVLLPRMGVRGARHRLAAFGGADAGIAAAQHAGAGLAAAAAARRGTAAAGRRAGALGMVWLAQRWRHSARHADRCPVLRRRAEVPPRLRRPRAAGHAAPGPAAAPARLSSLRRARRRVTPTCCDRPRP